MYIKNVMLALVFTIGFVACGESQQTTYKLFDTTNDQWTKGVAKGWATAFFVNNTDQAKIDFAVGRKVIFSDGSVRTVTGTTTNSTNLIVYLDGPALNGDLVGYPNSVKPQPN